MMMSPTARSLKWLRDHGIEAQVVEKIVPHHYTKIDLFGCIDIIALDGCVLGIQTTDGSNHAARRTKARGNTKLVHWLDVGARFEIWSWRKSERTKRWTRRVDEASHVAGELHFAERTNDE